jgi:hypothetical protein
MAGAAFVTQMICSGFGFARHCLQGARTAKGIEDGIR